MKFYKYINTIPEKPIVGGKETEFNPGDTIMVRKGTQANYYWEQYKVAADGLVHFVRGITDDQWSRMERLSSEQISKVESITTGDINKLKQDYTRQEIDEQIINIKNLANSSRISLNGGTVLPVPPRRPDNTVIEDAWVRLAQGVTYTQAGGDPLTGIEGHETVAEWNNEDGEWVLVDMGELPSADTNGEIIPTDNRAVSGDTTYKTLEPYIAIGVDVETELYRGNGTFTAEGNYRLSDNWISTRIVEINPLGGEVFTVEGYQESGNKLVTYYAESDELNQTPFDFSYGSSNPSPQTFITPPGYTKMIVQVASGSNVGADIPNSPFQESFKLIKGEVPRVKAEMVKGVIDTPQLAGLRSDITTLQDKPDFANFEGVGFPQYELGVDGDKYFDHASKREFTKQHGKWVPKSLSRFYPVPVPTEFGWDIGRRVMYQENGKSFIEGWKGLFEEKAKADFDRLTKYYVSRSVGSDSNDGLTPETAFATVEHAHSIGARNIIVEQGVYTITGERQMRVITDDDSVTEPFIVRCLEGKALMARAYLGSEYSWTGENAYAANRTNVLNVVDLTHFDEEGNYAQLIRVDSVQECQELPGSYYPLSSAIHVHTFDSRVPDENILLCFAAATGYTPGAQVPYCYMENISVINQQASGSSGAFVFRNNVSEQYDCEVYLKNCYSGNNALGDGIAIDNIKVAILEGCSSAYVYRDALNYHTSLLNSGYEPIKVLEIDCEGYDTGTYWPGEYSSNGSTMHEGGTILRINGNYRRGSGSVVVDVNPGIRSLNISVEANDTTLNDGFRVNGEGSIMWLYGCVAYSDLDGANSLRAQDGATAYYDSRCIFPNNIDGDVIPE